MRAAITTPRPVNFDYSARYVRLPRLLRELALARADGRYPKLLRDYAKTQILIIDDWGLAPLTAEGRRDLLELLEDCYNHPSTVVTSPLPVAAWHAYLNEPTLADAILRSAGSQRLHLQPHQRIPAKTPEPLDQPHHRAVTLTHLRRCAPAAGCQP